MTKIAVIYYSQTGTTYQLARAVQEGATQGGAEVRLRKVQELAPEAAIKSNPGWAKHREETKDIAEATNQDLEWADGIIFGTPTRYGLPASQLKQFMDQTGPLWAKGLLANKVASSFTSTATPHGGQETTILAMNNVFYHWGCIIVNPGYLEANQFQTGNPYGVSHVSNNGTIPPGENILQAARFQGRRTAEIAKKISGG